MNTNMVGSSIPSSNPVPADPAAIPANPSTKELYQLMRNTHLLLAGFQQSAELRLESLEKKASTNIAQLNTVKSQVDINIANISHVNTKSTSATAENKRLSDMLQSALVRLDTLEKDVNFIDRGIRGHNLCFINIPEESDENCLIKIANVIKNNAFNTSAPNMSIDDIARSMDEAHRVGKQQAGQHRQIIVKLHSKRLRDDII